MEKINETIATIQANAPVCHYIYDVDALAAHVQACVQSLPENCEMYYACLLYTSDAADDSLR